MALRQCVMSSAQIDILCDGGCLDKLMETFLTEDALHCATNSHLLYKTNGISAVIYTANECMACK